MDPAATSAESTAGTAALEGSPMERSRGAGQVLQGDLNVACTPRPPLPLSLRLGQEGEGRAQLRRAS